MDSSFGNSLWQKCKDKAKESMENPPKEEKLEEVNGNNNPKKVRGRPLGCVGKAKRLKALALEGGEKAITTSGHEFNPFVIMVEHGEDLGRKVFSLAKKDGPNVCIFTATGAISKLYLCDEISEKIIKYEGIFEILYVKGTNESPFYMHIANEEGIVYKGSVCGPVFAAGKIQVVAATFCGKGTKKKNNAEELSEPKSESQELVPIEANFELPEFYYELEEYYPIEANFELPEFYYGPQEPYPIEANFGSPELYYKLQD